MSADRWTFCPNCKAKHEANLASEKANLAKSYGKIPAETYLAKVEELKTPEPCDETLREDFWQGINDGVYSVEYHAHCQICGFKFSFKHEEKLPKANHPAATI